MPWVGNRNPDGVKGPGSPHSKWHNQVLGPLILHSFHQMQTPVGTKGHTNPHKDVPMWKLKPRAHLACVPHSCIPSEH